MRQVDGEVAVLLSGGRALLMQLAHPQVAAGVDDHSDFETRPVGRLVDTLSTTYRIAFGDQAESARAAAELNATHRTVTGPGYRAHDPDLVVWVNATLIDSALVAYRRFVGPLPREDAERFYAEGVEFAERLGAPRHRQPPDLAAFEAYLARQVATLEVTDTARRLATAVLYPPVALPLRPVATLGREVTVGLLPERLRTAYGLDWGPGRERALRAAAGLSRLVTPRLPRWLRTLHVPLLTGGRARV